MRENPQRLRRLGPPEADDLAFAFRMKNIFRVVRREEFDMALARVARERGVANPGAVEKAGAENCVATSFVNQR